MASELCPCGTGREVEACCGRFVRGGEKPATAEELMRSRYAAYALGEVPYVLATQDVPDVDPDATARWARESEWKGLAILDTRAGGPGDAEGEVEFEARFRFDGEDRVHRERSRFRRRDGAWVYVGQLAPVARAAPRVGRNDPCPCGSGKKYKKCCGA